VSFVFLLKGLLNRPEGASVLPAQGNALGRIGARIIVTTAQRANRSPETKELLARWADANRTFSRSPGRCPGLGERKGLRPAAHRDPRTNNATFALALSSTIAEFLAARTRSPFAVSLLSPFAVESGMNMMTQSQEDLARGVPLRSGLACADACGRIAVCGSMNRMTKPA
jgi:hypothetical protein